MQRGELSAQDKGKTMESKSKQKICVKKRDRRRESAAAEEVSPAREKRIHRAATLCRCSGPEVHSFGEQGLKGKAGRHQSSSPKRGDGKGDGEFGIEGGGQNTPVRIGNNSTDVIGRTLVKNWQQIQESGLMDKVLDWALKPGFCSPPGHCLF